MKMPETIYVGVGTADADFLDPRPIEKLGGVWPQESPHLMSPRIDVGEVADGGFVAEYRYVGLRCVTKTTPAPIIEVKEVPMETKEGTN